MPTDHDDALAAVRALFGREQHGVLCTGHAGSDGWPYGSVVPFALLPDGDVAIFVSDVAEHTRNLEADSRATLLVRKERPTPKPANFTCTKEVGSAKSSSMVLMAATYYTKNIQKHT